MRTPGANGATQDKENKRRPPYFALDIKAKGRLKSYRVAQQRGERTCIRKSIQEIGRLIVFAVVNLIVPFLQERSGAGKKQEGYTNGQQQ